MIGAAYFRISEGEPLPDVSPHAPFKAVLVLDGDYSAAWQHVVSDWLVRSGCLYMMAWGIHCSDWDDSVDWANIEAFDFGDIPDAQSVMTTWHEAESLEDVFSFAEVCAHHPDVALESSLIIHVGQADRGRELLARYLNAQSDPSGRTEAP